MNHYAVYDTATGRYLQIVSGINEANARTCLQPGQDLHACDNGLDDSKFYCVNGAPVAIPPQPDANHIFDYTTKTWIDPRTLADIKAPLYRQIDAERDRRIAAPIQYAGRNVDADARAQGNVSGKLAEIAAREVEGSTIDPSLLVWRDADNGYVAFADMTAMKTWLQGLTVAIASRGTLAYAWAWAKKAALDAAATTAAALAFDPTT